MDPDDNLSMTGIIPNNDVPGTSKSSTTTSTNNIIHLSDEDDDEQLDINLIMESFDNQTTNWSEDDSFDYDKIRPATESYNYLNDDIPTIVNDEVTDQFDFTASNIQNSEYATDNRNLSAEPQDESVTEDQTNQIVELNDIVNEINNQYQNIGQGDQEDEEEGDDEGEEEDEDDEEEEDDEDEDDEDGVLRNSENGVNQFFERNLSIQGNIDRSWIKIEPPLNMPNSQAINDGGPESTYNQQYNEDDEETDYDDEEEEEVEHEEEEVSGVVEELNVNCGLTIIATNQIETNLIHNKTNQDINDNQNLHEYLSSVNDEEEIGIVYHIDDDDNDEVVVSHQNTTQDYEDDLEISHHYQDYKKEQSDEEDDEVVEVECKPFQNPIDLENISNEAKASERSSQADDLEIIMTDHNYFNSEPINISLDSDVQIELDPTVTSPRPTSPPNAIQLLDDSPKNINNSPPDDQAEAIVPPTTAPLSVEDLINLIEQKTTLDKDLPMKLLSLVENLMINQTKSVDYVNHLNNIEAQVNSLKTQVVSNDDTNEDNGNDKENDESNSEDGVEKEQQSNEKQVEINENTGDNLENQNLPNNESENSLSVNRDNSEMMDMLQPIENQNVSNDVEMNIVDTDGLLSEGHSEPMEFLQTPTQLSLNTQNNVNDMDESDPHQNVESDKSADLLVPIDDHQTESIENDSVQIDDKLSIHFTKLETFGKSKRMSFLENIKKESVDSNETAELFSNFLNKIESEFREWVREYKTLTGIAKVKVEKTAEEKARDKALADERARHLNQRTKERLLASSSESSDLENSNQSLRIKKTRKRKRIPNVTENRLAANVSDDTDDFTGIKTNKKNRILDSNSDSEEGKNTVNDAVEEFTVEPPNSISCNENVIPESKDEENEEINTTDDMKLVYESDSESCEKLDGNSDANIDASLKDNAEVITSTDNVGGVTDDVNDETDADREANAAVRGVTELAESADTVAVPPEDVSKEIDGDETDAEADRGTNVADSGAAELAASDTVAFPSKDVCEEIDGDETDRETNVADGNITDATNAIDDVNILVGANDSENATNVVEATEVEDATNIAVENATDVEHAADIDEEAVIGEVTDAANVAGDENVVTEDVNSEAATEFHLSQYFLSASETETEDLLEPCNSNAQSEAENEENAAAVDSILLKNDVSMSSAAEDADINSEMFAEEMSVDGDDGEQDEDDANDNDDDDAHSVDYGNLSDNEFFGFDNNISYEVEINMDDPKDDITIDEVKVEVAESDIQADTNIETDEIETTNIHAESEDNHNDNDKAHYFNTEDDDELVKNLSSLIEFKSKTENQPIDELVVEPEITEEVNEIEETVDTTKNEENLLENQEIDNHIRDNQNENVDDDDDDWVNNLSNVDCNLTEYDDDDENKEESTVDKGENEINEKSKKQENEKDVTEVEKPDDGNDADDAEEEDIDDVRDKEIDRLLDFTTLSVKKSSGTADEDRPSNKKPSKKSEQSKINKTQQLLEILKDSEQNDTTIGDSNSESDEDVLTEEQYLKKCNINTKEKLLKMSSSDSDSSDVSDEDDQESVNPDDAYVISEDSNDSAINTFLKKKIKSEIEKTDIKKDKTEEAQPETVIESPTKYPVMETQPIDDADDPGQNKEIVEKMDVEKDANEEERNGDAAAGESDEDVDENEENTSSTTANKRDRLDKLVFSKSLFSDLDDFVTKDEEDTKEDEDILSEKLSSDSDCEILDISMFKNNKDHKTMADDKMKKIMKQSRKPVQSKAPIGDCISLSSDSDLDLADDKEGEEEEEENKHRGPRRMLRTDQLAGETKLAQREEADRVKRLEKKNERLSQIFSQTQSMESVEESEIILDYDTKKKLNITVHPDIVKHLKEHQVAGVKFMYDSCYGSVDSIDKFPGSGCILAHCMGLGKTLQLIALLHTLIRHVQLKTNKVLVICPKSTVMNWADEIQRWLGPVKGGPTLKVYQFPDNSDINEKLKILRSWHNSGKSGYPKAGCFLIGYEAFRSLVFYHLTKKRIQTVSQAKLDDIKKKIEETLLEPGADLVICDEGHMIKNRKSSTSLAVNQIKTRRRIILTGTPIQNNLKEYYSMVNFIKPSFLGTEKEFANLYANPIKNGQHKDSSKGEIKFMKQRSYVLHKKLSKFVQRREAALLKTFLPEKYEYVLFIPMTEVQNKLYNYFLDNNPLKEKYGGKSLIPDYTFLRKIWTHPKVLENAWQNAVMAKRKKDAIIRARRTNADSEENDEPDDLLDNQDGKMSVTNDWWRGFLEPDDLTSLLPSNKLRILFEILKLCAENGEKCLIFSAFVAVLNVVEYFMQQIHYQTPTAKSFGFERFRGPWVLGEDYYRLDGKTPKSIRHSMITKFNNPNNMRTKCFLISAKAGGQGINLIGANRVIILDTSWNPSNDQQNIFRVFRLGQKNRCYIYRLLAMGTMEEKVYSRSVTKQAMSFRVVDEQQIDRHYSMAELAELYTLQIPDQSERPTPVRPYDNVLASLLHNFPEIVYKYHEHDSLLEKNSEENLSEQEKADAWAAYENDVSMKNQYPHNMANMPEGGGFPNMMPPYGNMGGGGLQGYPNMMNPFSGYGLPNTTGISQQLLSSYLSQLNSYPPGIDKELLMMSQMYSPPYPGRSSTGLPTASALNYATNYSSLFGGGSSSLFNSTMLPISSASSSLYNNVSSSTTTTSVTPSYMGQSSTSNVYSSNSGGGMSSASANATQKNLLASLTNFLPSFANMKSPSPTISQSPSSLTNTARPANASPQSNSMRDMDKNMWNYLNSTNPMYIDLTKSLDQNKSLSGSNVDGLSMSSMLSHYQQQQQHHQQQQQQQPPGPNAIKNPMLSKELSMPPSLVPVSNNMQKDNSFNLPSIPTSVITKTSNQSIGALGKDMQRLGGSANANRSSPTINSSMNINNSNNRPSIMPIVRQQQQHLQNNMRASPTAAATSMSTQNRQTNNSLNQQILSSANSSANRNTVTVAKTGSGAITISGVGDNCEPEPHLIVKNVNAINQSINKASTSSSTKASPDPIKNFNMGIVYPKKTDNSKFDLTQNASILKAAQSQLNEITNNSTTMKSINVTPGRINMNPTSSLGQNIGKSTLTKIVNRNVLTNQISPAAAGVQPTNIIRRGKDGTLTTVSSISKPNSLSIPSNIASEVTITPTGKRIVQNPSQLTINPIDKMQKPGMTYSRIQPQQTSKIETSSAQLVKNQPQTYQLANKKPVQQVKVTAGGTIVRTMPPLQSTTTTPATITRQNTVPILSGNLSTLANRQITVSANNLSPTNNLLAKQRSTQIINRQSQQPSSPVKNLQNSTNQRQPPQQQIVTKTLISNSNANLLKSQQSVRPTVTNANQTIVNRPSITRGIISNNSGAIQSRPLQQQSQTIQRQINRTLPTTAATSTASVSRTIVPIGGAAAIRKPNNTMQTPALVSIKSGNNVPRQIKVVSSQQLQTTTGASTTVIPKLQTITTSPKIISVNSASLTNQQRKRKLGELMPPNSSLSITEIKRPKLAVQSNSTLQQQMQPNLMKKDINTAANTRQSVKKINSFEGVTILPRKSMQSTQSSQQSSMEIVELE